MTDDWVAVNNPIKQHLNELRWRQRELACNRSHVSQAIVRELLHHIVERRRSARTLEQLAAALGSHPQHLAIVLRGRTPPALGDPINDNGRTVPCRLDTIDDPSAKLQNITLIKLPNDPDRKGKTVLISRAITDLTTNEVAKCIQEDDAILIPIGAVEQHGPSCPVGTDMILAQYIAPRVADAANILYGPVVPVGDSLVFTSFPGTIALRPSTLFALTVDYVTSLHRAGFRRFLMLGTHWDNHFPVAAAMSELADTLPDMRFIIKDFWEFSSVKKIMQEEFDEEGGHADAADAAILLAIDRSYVRKDLLTAEFPPVRYQVGRTLLRQIVTESGVIGSDQRKATVEAGKRLIDAIVSGYVAVIEDLRR